MAHFTIKNDGGKVSSDEPASASAPPQTSRLLSPLSSRLQPPQTSRLQHPQGRFVIKDPVSQSPDIRFSLQALVTKTEINSHSQPKRPVFLYHGSGDVSAETARSGILNAVTGALRDAIDQLTSKSTQAAYVVALDYTAQFRDDFVLYDRVAKGSFKVQVSFDAWVRNSTEAIKTLVKASHEGGGIDAFVRRQIAATLAALDEGASNNSLLDIILDNRGMVTQRLREIIQADGIEVDKVAVDGLMPFEGTREIVENRGTLEIRVRGSESRVEIGYKLELVRDPAQRNRLFLNQLPMRGSGDTISAAVQDQIVGFLDSRYSRDDFGRSLARIESDVGGALNGFCPQRFGLRVGNIEIFNRSPEIEDQLFDFQDQYRITGTSRILVVEHRGVIRCVDTGKASRIDPGTFKNMVVDWIKLETSQFLQKKTLADVVELFCVNEEAEENRIRVHLDDRVNERARAYGFNISPIIAVSQNIPERELVTGREFVVPLHEYSLNLRNSRTELQVYARLRLENASALKRYLRDDESLDEIVTGRIRQFLERELQMVAPDDFYKSDVANFGGEVSLRERWTSKLSAEFKKDFGLQVDGLRFGRGRDPVRDRYSQLLNATETIRFERSVIGLDGDPRQIGFVVQYHILSASKENWTKFQSKALSISSAREQLDEISNRIQAMYDFRIQYQPKFDIWQQAVFARHLRDQIRNDLTAAVASEFGLVIDVPPDGIFTIDVEPARDPVLKDLYDARTELERERVRLIRSNPGASDDWGGIEDELASIDKRIAMLDSQVNETHKKLTDQQLKLLTLENERQLRLAGGTVAALLSPPSATEAGAATDDSTPGRGR